MYPTPTYPFVKQLRLTFSYHWWLKSDHTNRLSRSVTTPEVVESASRRAAAKFCWRGGLQQGVNCGEIQVGPKTFSPGKRVMGKDIRKERKTGKHPKAVPNTVPECHVGDRRIGLSWKIRLRSCCGLDAAHTDARYSIGARAPLHAPSF